MTACCLEGGLSGDRQYAAVGDIPARGCGYRIGSGNGRCPKINRPGIDYDHVDTIDCYRSLEIIGDGIQCYITAGRTDRCITRNRKRAAVGHRTARSEGVGSGYGGGGKISRRIGVHHDHVGAIDGY